MPASHDAPSENSAAIPVNAAVFRARMEPSGLSFKACASVPLLLSLEHAGLDDLKIDSACRNGSCRTCISLLESGKIGYRIPWPGLSASEKQEGYILPCVAYPLSDVVLRIPV